jgi:hypothetical protein
MKTQNAYLIYWSSEGLESVTPIGQYEQIDVDNTFRILRDEDPLRNPVNTLVQTMILRARYNSHRHYELYAITAMDGITGPDIESMFEVAPNEAAKTIRSIGIKLYSDRAAKKRVVIE